MARRHKGKLSLLSNDIKPIVRQIGKGQRNVHPEIWARWAEILGKNLAARAVPQGWKRGKLFIAVASSAWMQELDYLKPTLLDKFANAVGPNVVKEIRLVLDPTMPKHDAEAEKETPPINKPSILTALPASVAQMTEKIEDVSVRSAIENAVRANWHRYIDED